MSLIAHLFQSFRSFRRDRIFSAVNVIGLSLGLVSCTFIFLFVHHSLTFDHYHRHLDQIYRINSSWVGGNDKSTMAVTSQMLAPHLVDNYSFVESACRVSLLDNDPKVQVDGRTFQTIHFRQADPSVLDIFTFKFLTSSGTKLKEGNVLLSSDWAQRLFGTSDCVGKTFHIGDKTLQVAAVYEDWPQNIDLPLNGVIIREIPKTDWEKYAYYTYVRTWHLEQLAKALVEISEERNNDQWELYNAYILREAVPLKGLHYAASVSIDTPKGNINYIYLFLGMGLILVVVVLVNISNLSVIRLIDQVKPVGLRKILGAGRKEVLAEQLGHLVLLFLLSAIIAETLFQLGSPYFTELTGVQITLKEHTGPRLIIFAAFLLMVLLAGFYAALVTSKISPAEALRKQLRMSIPGSRVRQMLVTFQFVVTGIVISILGILLQQWQFIQEIDLGFEPSNVLVITLEKEEYFSKVIRDDLARLVGNNNVSLATRDGILSNEVAFTTVSTGSSAFTANIIHYESNFLDVLGIHLLKGSLPKTLHEEQWIQQISQGVLINETMAKMLPKEAIEVEMDLDWMKARVTGVVMDYHFQTIHNKIEPLILMPKENYSDENIRYIFLKGHHSDLKAAEKAMLGHLSPEQFNIGHLEESILASYDQEQQAVMLILYFAVLSLFISALGIYGITATILKKRMFEVGMRKVLGANFADLMKLFGQEIAFLLGLSLLINVPLVLWIKDFLLGLYAYHPPISGWMLFLPNIFAVLVAGLIVVVQIRSATRVDPITLLRQE